MAYGQHMPKNQLRRANFSLRGAYGSRQRLGRNSEKGGVAGGQKQRDCDRRGGALPPRLSPALGCGKALPLVMPMIVVLLL